MNIEYRYILEKGSKKYLCPNCDKKSFVRYIDTNTGDYLPEQYGRCDRESKCGEWRNPYKDGYAKMIWEQEQKVSGVTKVAVPKQKYFRTQSKPQRTPEPVFFDFETFKQTLQPERYEKNIFIQNLLSRVKFPFEADEVANVIKLYRLGTVASGYRAGAITFPFIDIKNNVRAIQVKQFDNKNHTTGTDFLHSIIEKHQDRNNKPLPKWLEAYKKNETKVSCLFGEHLLRKYPKASIFLFEAPKTAIYSNLYFGFPEQSNIISLAVYNKSSFSFDKLKVLQGRFVYVFPDLSKNGNTYKEWKNKAKEYENRLPSTRFIFSDLLEQLSPQQDKEQGNDIADFLIKLDWRKFRKSEPEPQINEVVSTQNPVEIFNETEPELLKNWSNEITELENYFSNIELPKQKIKLNDWSMILNCQLFINSHLATVKNNNGNNTFLPYLERLQSLKSIVETKNLF